MNMNNTFDILLHEINSSQCVLFVIILHFILEHCIRNLAVYKMFQLILLHTSGPYGYMK